MYQGPESSVISRREAHHDMLMRRAISPVRGGPSGSPGVDTHDPDCDQRAGDEALQPITVILGDANRLLVQVLGALLDSQPDFRVVRSQTDIESALDAVDTVDPDVVLLGTDLVFQDLDRCITLFRERGTRSRLVVMSSNEDESVLEASIQAGAVGYIHGGLPPSEIVAAVRRVNGGDVLFAPQKLMGLLQRPARLPEPPEALTTGLPARRQLEVLQALARGMSTQEIADHLGITTHTVRSHVRNITVRLKAHTKLDAVMIALRAGWIEL